MEEKLNCEFFVYPEIRAIGGYFKSRNEFR